MGNTAGIRLFTFFIVLCVLIGLHWPFVPADAEANLGFSRGPFTDEGLYTAQVRNAMRTGTLDLAESDGVIKEPLFSLFAWGVLSVFGDSLQVMRWAMLGLTSALLAVLVAGRSPFSRAVLVGVPVLALSYYPFHYAHLALVEMTASLLIIAALWAVYRRLVGGGPGMLVLSALLIFLAYAMKVQFVYAAAIPPLAYLLAGLMDLSAGRRGLKQAVTDVVASSMCAVGFAVVFVVGWYIPNRALMSFVLGAQTSRRSSSAEQLVASLRDNIHMLLTDRRIWAVYLALAVGLVGMGLAWRAIRRRERASGVANGGGPVNAAGGGSRGYRDGRVSGFREGGTQPAIRDSAAGRAAAGHESAGEWTTFVALTAPPAAWVLIELHKLTLSYLPSRYFLSLIVALGLLAAAGLYAAWRWGSAGGAVGSGEAGRAAGQGASAPASAGRRGAAAYALPVVVALVLVLDARDYANAHARRDYVIRDTQAVLAAEGRWENQLVMGPWAATLFWGSGAITKPVWKDYFNDGEPIRALKPVALVSEPDQDDSEKAFESSGVALVEPPLKSVKVRNWTVNVYPGP